MLSGSVPCGLTWLSGAIVVALAFFVQLGDLLLKLADPPVTQNPHFGGKREKRREPRPYRTVLGEPDSTIHSRQFLRVTSLSGVVMEGFSTPSSLNAFMSSMM
jgi:hypothetical protein